MNYKLGSLFDGSGGFPLAGSLCGIVPAWASEVEPYPIAVTRSRFPGMKHLGDISKINGAEIEPVNVITFGSPCQDLSIAGKRAGLKHEANGDEETTRSGLFMEAVRIIKEMRSATNGLYPNVVLFENVPGAFSSSGGEDWRIVLEELIKIVEPTAVMPAVPKAGWAYADSYCGDGWSLAYRVFDAQYWGKSIRDRDGGIVRHMGTPQRRRRIHLVLHLTGQCARKILFEREGLRGHFAKGGTPRQGITPASQNGSGATKHEGLCVALAPVSSTLRAGAGAPKHEQDFVGRLVLEPKLFENHSQDTRYKGPLDICPMLPAQLGTGGNNTPFVVERRIEPVQYIVRGLSPIECARLQGFDDLWGVPDKKEALTDEEYRFWLEVRNTHAAINGKAVKEYTRKQMLKWYNKLHKDSSEYKMWGNGIALPPALYCMQGIVDALDKEKDAEEACLC